MKKKIPLVARRLIDKLYLENNNLVEIQHGENFYVRYNDRTLDSEFFFTINKAELTSKGFKYNVSYSPWDDYRLIARTSIELEENGVISLFESWLNVIKEYNEYSPVFDDPITQSYYDELEPRFNLIDEDKYYKPFSISQQKTIILIIDSVLNIIEDEKIDKGQKEEVISLAKSIKDVLSFSNKSKVIDSLRKFAAKCYKIGLNIGEKVMIEIAKKTILGQLGI